MITNAVEDFARKWAKKDKFDFSVLDDWISEIKCIVSGKIKTLQKRIKQQPLPVLTNPETVTCLHQFIKHQTMVYFCDLEEKKEKS